MKEVFAFDVDGTLTPARQPMVREFANFFIQFVRSHSVYLISGSDIDKLKEQLPQDLFNLSAGVFTCSAAEFWCRGDLVYRRKHAFAPSLEDCLKTYVENSHYPFRYGNHIEERPGMLNVSVVGRNACSDQRHAYNTWDKKHGERAGLLKHISKHFACYEASAGGEISVDVVPAGWNKSVALPEIMLRHSGAGLTFFGDKMGKTGNDRPLAEAMTSSPHHKAVPVAGFQDTWSYLCRTAAPLAA